MVSVLGLLAGRAVSALPSDRALSQLYHTQWTVQHGAPPGIERIAQTRDGYIWLTAAGRLFRFDGVEFERIDRIGTSPLPMERVYALWARPEGGLWVSYIYGGATFIGEKHVESYFTREGLPPNSITEFAEDGVGDMWAGTTRGLMRLDAGRWSFASGAWNLPQMLVDDLLLDRDGTMWVLNGQGLFYLRRGSRRFEIAWKQERPVDRAATLIASPDGVGWLAQARLGLTELRTPSPGKQLTIRWRPRGFESGTVPAMLIDRDSNLWLASSKGIARVPFSRAPDFERRVIDATGDVGEHVALAGQFPVEMLEDHEGNLWVVSNGGMDKFRSSAFTKLPLPADSQQPALAMADDGSIWIGTATGSVHRFEGSVKRESLSTPVGSLEALHRAADGTLWLGDAGNSIWHRRGDRWIEWSADSAAHGGGIQSMASEPGGAMWVSIVRAGVFRVVDNRWTLWGGRTDLPSEPATALAFDADGRLWLGYVNSRVAVIDRDSARIYDAADGLSTGAVQVAAVRGRNMWIGGERGLSRFDGRRFHNVVGAGQRTFTNVNGIIEKAYGDLWLNTSEGAVHIPASEVRSFISNPGHAVQFRLFNYLDGIPGAAAGIRPVPTAAESIDGRIWLSSTHGVVSLLPGEDAANPIVPNVYIKSVTVDGRRHEIDAASTSPMQLQANPRDLQISYTALSLAIPERVKFRYRLEGTNMGWQDVGMRREAYFTGLPPGNYRFQVIASNDAGVWNETGAALAFVIPPTFLQSPEFIVLCVASASAVLWLLFLLRMQQVKAQMQSRSEERLMERERIARELHDTFLQGVHGLMLRFQSATERIPAGEPARQLMEDALDRADRVLAEGRDKVSELRAAISLSLPESLAMVGNDLSRDYAVTFDSQIEGMPRELNPLVQEEVCRIGAEALTNAFRHANATHIRAIVQFGRRYLEIRVVDDGTGFDTSKVKPGRWGLKGMRERAERIRGQVSVSSKPELGTTVELRVPARLAYKKDPARRWHWPAWI